MAPARHPLHLDLPLRSRQPAHFDPLPEGLLTMWIVRLTDQPQHRPYGPFEDRAVADRFADFLTAEVDPAHVEPLHGPPAERLADPVTELLNWRDTVQRPTWRGGPDIGADAEHTYREEQADRD